MPLPVLGGSMVLRSLMMGASGGIAANLSNVATSPLSRAATYGINATEPNMLPSLEAAINAFNHGYLTYSDFRTIMLRNGAGYEIDDKFFSRIWLAIRQSGMHKPSIEDVLAIKWGGLATDKEIEKMASHTAAHLSDFEPLKKIRSDYAPVIQMLEMVNRGIMSQTDFYEILSRKGFYDVGHNYQMLHLRYHVPSVSDILHFLTHEVYNEKLRKEYKLDAEWEENKPAIKWLRMLGMIKGVYKDPETGMAFEYDIARDYWADHWRNAAIGQVFEMYHRFRPGRVKPEILVFKTKEEQERNKDSISIDSYLKLEDYSPVWRDRLIELSRPPLGRMDLIRSWRSGAFEKYEGKAEEELAEKFKDLGYADDNANLLADSVILQESRTLTKLAQRSTLQQLRKMFRSGLISETLLRESLKDAGLKTKEVALTVLRIKLEVKADYYEQYLKSVKRMFFQYRITTEEVVAMLATNIETEPFAVPNIDDEGRLVGADSGQKYRMQEIVKLWEVERLSRRKEVSASQLVKVFLDGLIEDTDFKDRLRRMNYSPTGIEEIFAMATIKKQEAIDKAIREIGNVETRMKKRPTLKMLEGWVTQGKLDIEETKERLRAHGFREDDVERVISEWTGGYPSDLPASEETGETEKADK